MTLKKLVINCLVVASVAALTFSVHFLINTSIEKSVTAYQLIYSYFINVLLACGVIILLFLLRKKLNLEKYISPKYIKKYKYKNRKSKSYLKCFITLKLMSGSIRIT